MNKVVALFLLILHFQISTACECPGSSLNLSECNKYEIIFKGRIKSVTACGDKLGEALFEIDELYKGRSTKEFTVLFNCNDPCKQEFRVGDEWVIYGIYKQINNILIDWCSRSRKYFKVENQDFYAVNSGVDYDDEIKFLRENLGLHRLMKVEKNASDNRNIKPTLSQTIITLLVSLVVVILFFWLFNKYFKF